MLPKDFENYSDARKAGFLRIMKAKEEGKQVAGTFCTFTPQEIIDAAGFLSVSLCGMSPEPIPAAETKLPRNLCPLIKSSYGFYLTDTCPYTYFADVIVGETTCDGKKKMYELLGQGKNLFLLHLPQSPDLEYSKPMWIMELKRFRDYFLEKFGIAIKDEDIRNAAKTRNRLRKAKTSFMELLKAENPPITGTELYTLLDGIGFKFDLEKAIEELESLTEKYKNNISPNVNAGGKRIMITGCPIGGVFKKVVGAIEKNGANVVCFENCAGIKPARAYVDVDAEDIFSALADSYLKIGCSVMTPNKYRMQNIPLLIKEFNVDAVLDVSLQACTTYMIESSSVKEVCKASNIPFMALETDYSNADLGQIDTRIAAFLETL